MAFRHLPCSIYDFPAMETWLADMAARGLQFDYFWGEQGAIFKKGEPKKETYRLEPADREGKPDEEQLALFSSAGWEFLGINSNKLIWVFRAFRPDPMPIHTDPETQAVALKRLQRRLRRKTLPTLALWAALAMLHVRTALYGTHVLQWAIDGFAISNSLYWIIYSTFWMVLMTLDLLPLRRLVRSLAAGVPMEHRGRYGWRQWAWWGMLAVLVCYILAAFSGGKERPSETYGLADCPVAYVSLAEMGAEVPENPSLLRDEYATWVDGALMDQWTVREGAWAKTEVRRIGSEWVTRRWQSEIRLYQADIPGLAGPLTRDILRNEPELLGADKLPDSPFDQAWYIREGDTQSLLARQGRRVLWVLMDDGSAEDLRDHLAAYRQVLDQDLPRER